MTNLLPHTGWSDSTVSTCVADTVKGCPASGCAWLARWVFVGSRCPRLEPETKPAAQRPSELLQRFFFLKDAFRADRCPSGSEARGLGLDRDETADIAVASRATEQRTGCRVIALSQPRSRQRRVRRMIFGRRWAGRTDFWAWGAWTRCGKATPPFEADSRVTARLVGGP